MSAWTLKQLEANIELMSKTLGIGKVTAQVMVNRGIRTKNTAIKFLNPDLSFLLNTKGTSGSCGMKDLEKTLSLLETFISEEKHIVIYGDYDVDGVTSTAILYKTLKKFTNNLSFYIPHREHDGYGLNKNAIKTLAENGAQVVITCDNGISAIDEVEYAKELGLSVIIIDHHEPAFAEDSNHQKEDIVPNADAIINPKQRDCEYPFKMLCTGGIVFKLAKEINEHFGADFSEHDELLALAMLPTFCDVVDLLEENRIIAKNGLDVLNKNKQLNKGLYALMKERGYDDKEVTGFAVGFVLGPCINAMGRLQRADLAVKLFITDDTEEAEKLAQTLVELNEERKALTNEGVERAYELLSQNPLEKVVVLYDELLHESIAGIVAGRIKERVYRPTIVLTKSGDAGLIKGSARSIEGYNIFEELFKCKHLFTRFGGHPMAAGLSLKHELLDTFISQINENCTLTDDHFVEMVYVDGILQLDDLTYTLASELYHLAPFGKGNKQPLFATCGVKIVELRIIHEKNTIIFGFLDEKTGKKIKGICFNMVEYVTELITDIFPPYDAAKVLGGVLRTSNLYADIVYYIDINEYNGDVSVQVKLKDLNLYL